MNKKNSKKISLFFLKLFTNRKCSRSNLVTKETKIHPLNIKMIRALLDNYQVNIYGKKDE